MLRRTKCSRAAKLIPLSMTNDLTRRQARFLAAHAETCESCYQLVAEYRASRSWFQETAARVEFAENFYAEIRSAVLSQIELQRPRTRRFPPPALFFVPQLNRPLAFAASVALLCLFAALAYQFVFRRAADQSHEQAIHNKQHSLSPSAPRQAAAPARLNENEMARDPQSSHDPPVNRRKRSRTQSRTSPALHRLPPSPTLIPQSRNEQAQSASTGLSPAQSPAAGAQTTPAEEISRIEIQTADPNIRIIWLTPKADASSPAKIIENR